MFDSDHLSNFLCNSALRSLNSNNNYNSTMIAQIEEPSQYPGWLDIHGHFNLPETPEEAEKMRTSFEQQAFYLKYPFIWDYDQILSYLERANIGMQMLSWVPQNHEILRQGNDFAASIVRRNPSRFGLLAGLPTDDAEACLAEINRTKTEYDIPADGYALKTIYKGVWLGDQRLEPVWAELNSQKAVVFIHPDALAPHIHHQTTCLIEVAFDTTRCTFDMLYAGVFRRYPDIRFVLAHAGGAIPALAGRLALLGTQDWAPNPHKLTREEILEQLGRLYVDTAASAATGLTPALRLMGIDRCVYGSDCGVPCSTEATMDMNKRELIEVETMETGGSGKIGNNGWLLFPAAAQRARKGCK
jgi:6-methylsalicylate decarboxylase